MWLGLLDLVVLVCSWIRFSKVEFEYPFKYFAIPFLSPLPPPPPPPPLLSPSSLPRPLSPSPILPAGSVCLIFFVTPCPLPPFLVQLRNRTTSILLNVLFEFPFPFFFPASRIPTSLFDFCTEWNLLHEFLGLCLCVEQGLVVNGVFFCSTSLSFWTLERNSTIWLTFHSTVFASRLFSGKGFHTKVKELRLIRQTCIPESLNV